MRIAVAALVALLATALLIALLYWFFSGVWARLPAWAAVPLSVLIAATAIGGPIWTLLRLTERGSRGRPRPPPSRPRR